MPPTGEQTPPGKFIAQGGADLQSERHDGAALSALMRRNGPRKRRDSYRHSPAKRRGYCELDLTNGERLSERADPGSDTILGIQSTG